MAPSKDQIAPFKDDLYPIEILDAILLWIICIVLLESIIVY